MDPQLGPAPLACPHCGGALDINVYGDSSPWAEVHCFDCKRAWDAELRPIKYDTSLESSGL